MWMLARYWKEIAIALVVGSLVWYIMSLRMSVVELSGRNKALQDALIHQGQLIDANRAEYETNMATYRNKEVEVETKWKTRIETIYVWEDKNVSCEDAMSRFDRTIY
jgi:hypothetical protein